MCNKLIKKSKYDFLNTIQLLFINQEMDNKSIYFPTLTYQIKDQYSDKESNTLIGHVYIVEDKLLITKIELYYQTKKTGKLYRNKEEPPVHLSEFYNIFKVPSVFGIKKGKGETYLKWKKWQDKIEHSSELKKYFGGLACSLLRVMLLVGVKEDRFKKEDIIWAEASGRRKEELKEIEEKKKISVNNSSPLERIKHADQMGLVNYYKRLGFEPDPDYFQKYKHLITLLYKNPELLENPTEELKAYNINIFLVPIYGKIIDVINQIKVNCNKQIDLNSVEYNKNV